MYFLVTASVAPIIATIQFLYGKGVFVWISAAGALGIVFGLLGADSALRALWFEVASYRSHIQYRYQRKSWDDLTRMQQETCEQLNRAALRFTRATFWLSLRRIPSLCGGWYGPHRHASTFASCLGISTIIALRRIDASLWRRYDYRPHRRQSLYCRGAPPCDTGRHSDDRTTSGVLSDPNQTIDAAFVDNLAREFAHFLRLNLDSAAAVSAF